LWFRASWRSSVEKISCAVHYRDVPSEAAKRVAENRGVSGCNKQPNR
jgi:hypothetical protein